MSGPLRIDRLLVELGLAESRTRAQALVRQGLVEVLGRRVEKPSERVDPEAPIEVTGQLPYVSRGGHKLEGALEAFGLDVAGRSVIDVGASTGGFTDCLLQRGASRVLAVDVGTDQLHEKLRGDPRVVSREGTDVRGLSADALPFVPDLVVVDASFVSLSVLAESLAALVPTGARLVALVKPQFEVGPEGARRGKGVIRDPALRQRGIDRARRALVDAGFEIAGGVDSSVAGPEGNVEHFLLARRL